MMKAISVTMALSCLVTMVAQSQDNASGTKPAEHPVMVIHADAELKSQSVVVGKAALAEILVGRETNGNWLWIPAAKGWIQQSDVVAIDKAIDYFTRQIQQSPTSRNYFERGAALVALNDFEKAAADFSKSIELDPQNVPAINDRGTTYRRLGRLDHAKADFDTVIARGTRHPGVYTNRAMVWLDMGNVEQAMVDLHAALDLDQKFAPAWEASGAAREVMGDIPKAIDDYRVAVEIDPAFALAWNNRAWLLATTPNVSHRNGRQAVEFATKACELTGYQQADIMDTLAAAHAEAGQFEQAVSVAKGALKIADENEKAAIKQRLALYEAGQPYRQQK
ncbi:MAG: tetratricopeptide repeat protein [Rhodopirellula sp.]|nr:tetratricopeptide repeat protein [Rhodopirellula sp.]